MELPRLKGMWEKYRHEGLSIIAVNTYPNEEGAEEFWRKHELTFHNLIDDERKYKEGSLEFYGHPATIMLDKDRRVVGFKLGFYEGDEVKLEEKVVSLLQQ